MAEEALRIREFLQAQADKPADEAVVTGFALITEWSAGDGEPWLTVTAGNINDEGPPVWAVKGWLKHALDTAGSDHDDAA